MIASTISGRIRVRSNKLKVAGVLDQLKKTIQVLDGVKEVRCNQKAGSLIVTYDINLVPELEMEDQIESICANKIMPSKSTRRTMNKTKKTSRIGQFTKLGMIATLVPTVAYGFMGKKKKHIYAGTAFLVFTSLHMGRYSERLLK